MREGAQGRLALGNAAEHDLGEGGGGQAAIRDAGGGFGGGERCGIDHGEKG